MTEKKDVWIAGIARGHNAGVCLLKNGKIVFSIEEERLSRMKYDGGPFASIKKILDYTDKLDYLVVAHTQKLAESAARVDFTGDDVYTGLARKFGLIGRRGHHYYQHSQVVDLSHVHHKLHAACAFYRSGFSEAAALVVDGAGTFMNFAPMQENIVMFEVESIFDCNYPHKFKTVYKHIGTKMPVPGVIAPEFGSELYDEQGYKHEAVFSDRAGITKVYEAVTGYCGFQAIEAGKTMGLFPYGKPNDRIPPLFDKTSKIPLSNRNVIIPTYPNSALVNMNFFEYLENSDSDDLSLLDNRRDLAYAVQTETQEQVLRLIRKAAEMTGHKKVVISGGYGLNCVANYYYLEQLRDEGIEIYVEPISNDAGTAMGAALMFYHQMYPETNIDYSKDGLYLGPKYDISNDELTKLAAKYSAEVIDATHDDVVDLMQSKNIVALFQGRSENGPRALGNRSLLFDPTFVDGKDFVNLVKKREYFRPFAGTILQDHVHDWFDLRGKEDSPHMMYAVNCKEGVAEKIPSIIHVDGTCRIQTVTRDQNPHYYDIIQAFYKKSGIPIVFNTSFNLGGDPLVETLEDAIETLAKSEIEYLYLPELGKLVKVLN